MKKPEEIKEGLKIHCSDTGCFETDCAYVGGHGKKLCTELLAHDALAYIEQLETDNEMLMGMVKIGDKATKWREEWADKQIANAESKVPKWISIAERQPEINEKTLVCVERPMFSIKTHFTVDTAFYIGNGVWQYKFEKRPHVTYRPKYWMPLPEPPKEK